MSAILSVGTTVERESLMALDRLNSWVRSESYRHGWGGAHHVIYWLKGEAIRWMVKRGLASHRRIGIDLKCRACAGTGRYVDRLGHEWPHCRACSSNGTAHLSFIETTVLGQIIWHTPLIKATFLGCLIEEEQSAGDWAPNKLGRDLQAHEAARLLNQVEQHIPHNRYPERWIRYDSWGDDGDYCDDWNRYTLYVGRTDSNHCHLCGAADNMVEHGFGVTTNRIEWTGHICQRCNCGEVFDKLRVAGPRDLIAHPDIQAWIERHPVAPSCNHAF